jgi:RNA polymerase sigma factor (sigma-70 family)
MRDSADELVAAAIAGDESAFAPLTERHRRELHVHCYRMLASFDEAEDAVQDTFLRAWRKRASFGGDLLFRAWLYRIATNVCLDVLRTRSRRAPDMRSFDVPWLQPYPDRLRRDHLLPRHRASVPAVRHAPSTGRVDRRRRAARLEGQSR